MICCILLYQSLATLPSPTVTDSQLQALLDDWAASWPGCESQESQVGGCLVRQQLGEPWHVEQCRTVDP